MGGEVKLGAGQVVAALDGQHVPHQVGTLV